MARKSRFSDAGDSALAEPSRAGQANGQAQQTAQQGADDQQADEDAGAVRGPTSALTSFLREQGIRARHRHPYARAADPQQPEAGPSNDRSQEATPDGSALAGITEAEEEEEEEIEDPDSDDLDGPVASSSRATAAASSSNKRKVASSETNGSKKKKKASKGDEDDDYDDGPPVAKKPGRYDDRKPGHITICRECGRKFTVTRYTASHWSGEGQLCDPCAKESKPTNGAAGGAEPVKKKRAKRAVQGPEEKTESSIVSLQASCINLIAKNIDGIEALGDIGTVNLDRICQIVCKHRALVPGTLPLFLDIGHAELRLYDCVNLHPEHLISIAIFCPRLSRLMLQFAGHLDGPVLAQYGEKLTSLNHLDLTGAYLVRAPEWQALFQTWATSANRQGENMRGFLITQSPRFDLPCISGLVAACPNLVELRLADVGLLSDTALGLLHPLKHLTSLEIPNAGIRNGATGEALTDDGVIDLLIAVGANLENLDISQNKLLTDRVLLEGIKPSCPILKRLNLTGLGALLTTGVEALFSDWINKGLRELRMARCVRVGDAAMLAIIKHSGLSLRTLDLNSMDELREDGLKALADASGVTDIDVSFVRDVDDFTLKALFDGMPDLRTISVWGNNRVSDLCPRRKGVRIIGLEQAIEVR